MAVFKQIEKKYITPADAIRALNYVGKDAYEWGVYPGLILGQPEVLWAQMDYIKRYYGKTDGNLLEHYVLSFDSERYEKDVGLDVLERCLYILLETFCEFQPVWGIHLVESHYHIHIVINTVNAVTGKKYHKSQYELMRLLRQLADELRNYYIALLPISYYDDKGRFRYGKVPSTFLYQNKNPFIYG